MQGMRLHSSRQASFRPFAGARRPALSRPQAATNGSHSTVPASKPTSAETARTIIELATEGTLSTLGRDGFPVGSPVTYSLDKEGHALVELASGDEMKNLAAEARCSLHVQPAAQPARSVASVTLLGRIKVADQAAQQYLLEVEKCLYFGGLDQGAGRVQEVGGEDFRAAEPDVLRKSAAELVSTWNQDRAEDIYRIVSHFQGVPLSDMAYAELLWVDRLGMYIRSDVTGKEPAVVRVPFYRAVLDDRDARAVITMASQMAWEAERHYTPPLPAFFTDSTSSAAAAAAASN